MNKYPSVSCKHCGKEFETQIKIDPAIYAMVPNIRVGFNSFTCPHCENLAVYSEVDFRYTSELAAELANFGKIVKAFIHDVEKTGQPLRAASELLSELEEAKEKGDVSGLRKSKKFTFLKKWLPNSPEKIAAYMVILTTIIQLLTEEPDTKINQTTIINRIDQTVIMQFQGTEKKQERPHKIPKIRRNEPCPCGSGKKYKFCHGRST